MPLRTLTVTTGSVAEVQEQEQVDIREAGMCEIDIADLEQKSTEFNSTVSGSCGRDKLKSSVTSQVRSGALDYLVLLFGWNLSLITFGGVTQALSLSSPSAFVAV